MARALTLEDLKRANTATFVLPALSATLGEDVEITYGTVQRAEWMACWPKPIPGQEAWPVDEWDQRLTAHLANIGQEERLAYESGWAKARALLCMKAVRSVALTLDAALDLGPDLVPLSVAILRLSGLIQPERQDAAPADEEAVAAA